MIRHLTAFVVMFTIILANQEMFIVPFDLLWARMYCAQISPSNELFDISLILKMLPILPLIPIIFLLGAGLICLAELDR